MNKKSTLLKKSCFALLTLFVVAAKAQVSQLSESFDVIVSNTATPVTGWTANNLSSPAGTTGWFQGSIANFPAFSGAGYISANYQNGPSGAAGTLSNWLISPLLNLQNGNVVKFFTRTTTPGTTVYPDRLQVRLSTAAASVNVGATATSTGDFGISLLDINPTYTSTGFPSTWTQYTATLSGITAGATGRIAFRYFVEDGGGAGNNSDLIGIDQFYYGNPIFPVNLFDFSGTADDKNTVSLSWKTATELNSAYFGIERSLDGINFGEVGKVTAKGNSNATAQYSFSDDKVAIVKATSAYYRLKMVDTDGSYKYSAIVAVKLKKSNQLLFVNASVYGSTLTVRYNAATKEKTTIAVYNSTGMQVANSTTTSDIGINTFTFNGRLAGGLYFIYITNGTEKVTGKLVR